MEALYYDTIIIIVRGDFVWRFVPLLLKYRRNLDFVALFILRLSKLFCLLWSKISLTSTSDFKKL